MGDAAGDFESGACQHHAAVFLVFDEAFRVERIVLGRFGNAAFVGAGFRFCLNFRFVLEALFDDRLFFSGTLGYAPIPSNIPVNQRAGISTWISREHYLGFTPIDWFGVYAGMMDPVFGLRVPEHTAFIRSQTGLDKNDQTHGLLLRFASERFELTLHGMLGNLLQPISLRQRGGSAMIEWEVADQLRIGASYLRTMNDNPPPLP